MKDKKQIWWNRLQLIMLLALFSAPIIGAFIWKPTGYVNHGQLYERPLDLANIEFELKTSDGDIKQNFADFERKWHLVVVAKNNCGQLCEENLLKIRQLKWMQGKNIGRVNSLFVYQNITDEKVENLKEKYHGIVPATASNIDLERWLWTFSQGKTFDSSKIYVIDPLGKLMMSYPAGMEPKKIYKDLKRLLKVSQVG